MAFFEAIKNAAQAILQSKTVTAGTSATTVTPDSGYDGLSDVTVNPTPSQEKTVTSSTSSQIVTPDSGKLLSKVTVNAYTPTGNASASDVLSGKTFMNSNGAQTGAMPNRGAVSGTATPSQPYTIPEGYHNGLGTVTAQGGSEPIPPGYHLAMRYNTVATLSALVNNSFTTPNDNTAHIVNVSNYTSVTLGGSTTSMAKFNDSSDFTPVTGTTIDLTGFDYFCLFGGSAITVTFS